MTYFITTPEMLILADSSTMKIRVGLIGGPWLQQLTPLQDSGLNVPQIADEQTAQYIMGTFSHRIYASSHRMGLGAVLLLVKGHLNEEMPRYLYQRLRHGLPIHNPKYLFLCTYLCQ